MNTEAERGIVTLLQHIGEDVSRDGLKDTPGRVVRAYEEMTKGYGMDVQGILSKVFDIEYNQMVVSRDIQFTSLCEHHLLPFHGVAHIAYVPDKHVVGLSKLARTVDCYAWRLQVQERMTDQIGTAINKALRPQGVGVVICASHMCMGCRGVRKPEAKMLTSYLSGVFKKGDTRHEFLRLAGM